MHIEMRSVCWSFAMPRRRMDGLLLDFGYLLVTTALRTVPILDTDCRYCTIHMYNKHVPRVRTHICLFYARSLTLPTSQAHLSVLFLELAGPHASGAC